LPKETQHVELRKLRDAQSSIVSGLNKRYSTMDYEYVRKVGHGAFGIVSLVRSKHTGELFALKQIRKDAMHKKNHRERILAEKSLLSGFTHPEWVVKLYRTFQDQINLYMVMEYLHGGDLMSHLVRLDTFSEDQTRFYMAELIQAVHTVHRMGFIHRDIKPDNIVLTCGGHLKLIDFGLCKFDPTIRVDAIDSDRNWVVNENHNYNASTFRNYSKPPPPQNPRPKGYLRSSVGTPQYMAPEVLSKAYDNSSDYWSVGMIAYECLMGGTPFYDDTAVPGEKPNVKRILQKVLNWNQYLPIPYPGKHISPECASFLRGVLCVAENRLKYDQIRTHPFFASIGPWENLQLMRPPIGPTMTARLETSATATTTSALPGYCPTGIMKDRNMEFVGYTFDRFV
jgi:protein-serine/threonine kinase